MYISRRLTSAPLSMRSFIPSKKQLDEDIESALCPSAFLASQSERVCFHRRADTAVGTIFCTASSDGAFSFDAFLTLATIAAASASRLTDPSSFLSSRLMPSSDRGHSSSCSVLLPCRDTGEGGGELKPSPSMLSSLYSNGHDDDPAVDNETEMDAARCRLLCE